MSWMGKLYRTYENNTDLADPSGPTPLLPICHTVQNAQIHVVINARGDFLRASVVPKDEAKTIIPATEESAGRTSGPVPHPLCDKLQYVAGDYKKYGGAKVSSFEQYCSQLERWCQSPHSHPKAQAILTYVLKKSLIQDLVAARVLHTNDSGVLLARWPGPAKEAPEIFRVVQGQGGQSDALVRFSVEEPGVAQSPAWSDTSLWNAWIRYYQSGESREGLCYVTGDRQVMAKQHPKNIRRPGDAGKLISSNDTAGYTFRGRFLTADEACGVGFEVTQKAHNALRWLIAKQGYRDGDQAIVAWAVSGSDVPDPTADSLALVLGSETDETPPKAGYTAENMGRRLAKRMAGYSAQLGDSTDVVVMGLDSGSPGRMAITFCRELTGSELLKHVQDWHEGCAWSQRLGKDKVFVGAPAPRDIAEAAYGPRIDNKLRKAAVSRLLRCIIDGEPVPRDLVDCCVRRASKRNGMEGWEWEKTLGIACALYRHQYRERGYLMELDINRNTRDYLYGRLLALAEHLEARALHVAGEDRETNAARLMQRFADHPHTTWRTLKLSLTPYQARLHANRPKLLSRLQRELDQVHSCFEPDQFLSDSPLSGEFLLGYHCQRKSLWESPKDDDGDDTSDTQADESAKENRR